MFFDFKCFPGRDVGRVLTLGVIQFTGGGTAVKVQEKPCPCSVRGKGIEHFPILVHSNLKLALHLLAAPLQDRDQPVQHLVAVGCFGIIPGILDYHGIRQLVVSQFKAVAVIYLAPGSRCIHAALCFLHVFFLIIAAVQDLHAEQFAHKACEHQGKHDRKGKEPGTEQFFEKFSYYL